MLFDSSAMEVRLVLVDGDAVHEFHWQAGRALARDMLAFLRDKLAAYGAAFGSIAGIGVKSGPGSYTGLRIGLSVLNTLAEAHKIPIVGATGDDWNAVCLARLRAGENDGIVMPFYGGEAHVTAPRK